MLYDLKIKHRRTSVENDRQIDSMQIGCAVCYDCFEKHLLALLSQKIKIFDDVNLCMVKYDVTSCPLTILFQGVSRKVSVHKEIILKGFYLRNNYQTLFCLFCCCFLSRK